MPPQAADLLHSSLVGMDALFGRVEIYGWQDRVRPVMELGDPDDMAAAYRRMSAGSASGTFHDLTISKFNRHPISEQQEPWVNELLATFQALAGMAADAIASGGAKARISMSLAEAARRYPWQREVEHHAPSRDDVHVYAFDCTTCGSRFLEDLAVASAAAKRWAVRHAPQMITANRSVELVAAAFDSDHDPDAQRAVEEVRPAAEQLGLPEIRLPYNRPDHQADDRCPVCGADTWKPVMLRLTEDPLRL
ncbi:MAG TPA: hypothetical protein VK736_05870, partial [Candidatus Binatia bacterium]|nr:hypothetical protein [Candidatus Binatia bacterium]